MKTLRRQLSTTCLAGVLAVSLATAAAAAAPSIVNPSFEENTFTNWPGYVNDINGTITGWSSQATGGYGINPVAPFGASDSPFADNGTVPNGQKVLFIQNDITVGQIITGFEVGTEYQIWFYENARNGGTPWLEVKMAGQTIVPAHPVTQVGGTNAYRLVSSELFTAAATEMLLGFVKSNPGGGDTTVLVDYVRFIEPNTPPVIGSSPQSQEVALGQNVTFSLTANGRFPLAYQWYFEDAPISNATNRTHSFLLEFADQGGSYYAVVSNASGSVTSAVARLTVRVAVPGLFNTGVDATGAALPDNSVDPHYILTTNAHAATTQAIVEESTTFPIVAGPWLANDAFSKWIGPTLNTAAGAVGVYVYKTEFDLTGLDAQTVVITGGWAVDNTGVDILVNGQSTGVRNSAGFGGLSSFTINSANATFVEGINTLEFIVSNDVDPGYTGLRIGNLRGLAALPGTPPSVKTQPASYTAGVGETVEFRASAEGSSPLSYQWFHNDTPVPDVAQPLLRLANVAKDQAGTYYLVVSNFVGSATSLVAVLRVLDPIPGVFNTGVDASGTVLPDDAIDPHYKLVVNPDGPTKDPIVEDSTKFPIVTGPWVANTTSSKWIGPRLFTEQAAGGDYTYRLEFDGTGFTGHELYGNWTSDNAGLDIVVNGVSSGNANTGAFSSYTPFAITNLLQPGPNVIEFKVNNAALGYTGLRVDALRAVGTLLPPGTAPFIVRQPQNTTVRENGDLTLRVVANGTPSLSYQWLFEGSLLPDQTNATLLLRNVFPDMAGNYSVQVTSDLGSVDSTNAVVTVGPRLHVRMVLVNGAPVLLLGGNPGTSYVVESSETLNPGSWQTFTNVVYAPSQTWPEYHAIPLTTPVPARFFRAYEQQ